MLAQEGRHEFGDKTGSGMVLTSYVLSSNLQSSQVRLLLSPQFNQQKNGKNIKRKGIQLRRTV